MTLVSLEVTDANHLQDEKPFSIREFFSSKDKILLIVESNYSPNSHLFLPMREVEENKNLFEHLVCVVLKQ